MINLEIGDLIICHSKDYDNEIQVGYVVSINNYNRIVVKWNNIKLRYTIEEFLRLIKNNTYKIQKVKRL